MHEGYTKYLDVLKERGLKSPMSEKEWKEGVGIKDEEFIPIVSRTHSKQHNIVPTFTNHAKPTKTPIKINIIDTPKVIKLKKPKRESTRIKITDEEKRAQKKVIQKRWYRNSVKRQCGREVKSREYMSLEGLTYAQKKERRLQQQRDYKKRKREELINGAK